MMAISQRIVGFSPSSRIACAAETTGKLAALSAWSAFRSGMQILQRYANRSPIDIHTIAKSNMQLLHRSLSYDAEYINNIEIIKYQGKRSDLPTIRRLHAEQELSADVMAFQEGVSINLIALPQRYTMYLLISGTAQLSMKNTRARSEQHWWNRIGINGDKNYLRKGAVVICPDRQKNKQLTALGKDCIVLRVHIPTLETPAQIAS
jgi:hypothetical protein